MKAKLLSYGIIVLGLIGLLLSTKKIMESVSILKNIVPKYIVVPSLILIGIGIILIISISSEKSQIGKEVPIYKGKEIVGYRVVK